MRTNLAIALVVAATVVWGATFPVVKSALADTGPLTFLALRFSAAAVLLVWKIRLPGGSREGVGWAAACGASLYVGYLCQTWGLLTTTPARSAFITALSAIMVPLVEPLVGLSRFSPASSAVRSSPPPVSASCCNPTVARLRSVTC